MKLHLLSGFLGSGKTTAISQACKYLQQLDVKVGVITNDQGGRLVDRGFFEHLNIPNRQVSNGCFCCNYDHLENGVHSLMTVNRPDVIFAESVGSCTDIVATVMNPLLHFHPRTVVTLSVLADVRLLKILLQPGKHGFTENVRYIFFKQLEEAPVILVTRTDLIDEESLQQIKHEMTKNYSEKIWLYQNTLDPKSIQKWLDIVNNDSRSIRCPSALKIDYNTYGEGERELAWHDQEIEIYSIDNKANNEACAIIKNIYQKIKRLKIPIGHLKFLLNRQTKVSFTSTSEEEIPNNISAQKAPVSYLLINARVQTSPQLLAGLIREVFFESERELGCKIMIKSEDSFRPGYPKPVHRLAS